MRLVVGGPAMPDLIEPHALGLVGDAKPPEPVHDLEDREAHPERIRGHNRHRGDLRDEEVRPSIEEALRAVHEGGGEHARRDHADRPPDPVARPYVKRVVPPAPGPELRRRVAAGPRDDPDDHGGPRRDEPRGGGDGGEARPRSPQGARRPRPPAVPPGAPPPPEA